MAASLRNRIENAQFQTFPSTSVQSVAAKFARQPPISVLRLAKLLKPETLVWDTGWVTGTGDEDGNHLVEATGQLSLTSLGSWDFWGQVHDLGEGATFAFAMTPKVMDPSGYAKLFGESDELNDNEIRTFRKEGHDMWIGRNWDDLLTQGYTWSLKASASSGVVGTIFAVVLTLGLAAIFINGAKKCTEQGGWKPAQQQPDGSTTIRCEYS